MPNLRIAAALAVCLLACGEGDGESTPERDAGRRDATDDGPGEEGARDAARADARTTRDADRDSRVDEADASGEQAASPSELPTKPADCPTLREGDVMFGDSKVRIWAGDKRGGPLVIYWHGTCSSPIEPQYLGIGLAGIARIKQEGGVVAAIDSAYKSPDNFCAATGLAATEKCPGTPVGNGVWCREDFGVADDIVACAIDQLGVDPSRIHTAGMSAGGVMSVAYGYARSGYIASLTSYSGGGTAVLLGVKDQDPDNKFPAMIVHGGERDVIGAANFPMLAKLYQDELTRAGRFSFVCNHGAGHTIPMGLGDSTVQFFLDHPFGVSPEPYLAALPASFPSYCTLP